MLPNCKKCKRYLLNESGGVQVTIKVFKNTWETQREEHRYYCNRCYHKLYGGIDG